MVKDPAQVHNLINDPKYADEIKKHRALLDAWLAKGDTGQGEESAAALRHNGDDWQGGRGVNPEYEINRSDSDGDGLSDKWEKLNKRDPNDGRLYFAFDCGGWQTEGWTSNDIADPLAGFQGFLGFDLNKKQSVLTRQKLNAKVTDADKSLLIKLRADKKVSVQTSANGKPLGATQTVSADNTFNEIRIPLSGNKAWKGTIETLSLQLDGSKGSAIEIDSIEVER